VAKLHNDKTEKAAALPPAHTPVSVLFDETEEETKELPGQNRERRLR